MTRRPSVAIVLAAASLATCSRVNRPCPTPRPFVGRAPTRAPSDAATTAAVEATGARYQVCRGGTTYRIDRRGARSLTDAELRAFKDALYFGTPIRGSAGIGGVACPPAKPDLGVKVWIRENTAPPRRSRRASPSWRPAPAATRRSMSRSTSTPRPVRAARPTTPPASPSRTRRPASSRPTTTRRASA